MSQSISVCWVTPLVSGAAEVPAPIEVIDCNTQ